ncbi:MAG: biotin/lipoyl-containing protein, partial [Myxococcota bacterium]
PDEWFDVTSLVEAMALLAQHKQRLPRPQRILREPAAVEARLNATDASLSPHAGGIINYWSDPIEGEVRDDQGISAKNPDTGRFVRYKVAGAYDSNIALLVTTGRDRADSYRRLSEILRCTQLRGIDLETNLEFHYGLVHWFTHRSVWAKPTTRFVSAYLALVGLLKRESGRLDLDAAWASIRKKASQAGLSAAALNDLMLTKHTLVQRPVRRLLASPHLLSGWLSQFATAWSFEGETLVWRRNPLEVLEQTYHFLNMFDERGAPPAQVIWDHDAKLLKVGLGFYRRLQARLGVDDYVALLERLDGPPPSTIDAELWRRIQGAHAGHQLGLPILGLLGLIGRKTDFFALKLNDDLTVHLPEKLLDGALQAQMKKVLVPPPVARSDEILAVSGGMFYAQEAPDRPKFVDVGSHFEAGQPLYIIEVMKMFNRVPAPFAGTIEKILLEGGNGTIVKKGQPLFKVRPDEQLVDEDPADVAARRRAHTESYFKHLPV